MQKTGSSNIQYTHKDNLPYTELFFFDSLNPDIIVGDFGSGPNGAIWWNMVPGMRIDAFDLLFSPTSDNEAIAIHQLDLTKMHTMVEFEARYDLIVADHIFEHVDSPRDLAKSIAHALKPDGLVHVGIPDATNFTDRFYRLIHPNGGGHIAQFTRDSMIALMEECGFSLLSVRPWYDDWLWFEKLYDLNYNNITHLTNEERVWLANVFRKELTPEKGYYYGWEYMFRMQSASGAS